MDDEEIDEEELKEYATMLGIDMVKEKELMWIARSGIAAPLPPNWTPVERNGEVYFYNSETNESVWEHPSDDKYRKMVQEERKNLMLKKKMNDINSNNNRGGDNKNLAPLTPINAEMKKFTKGSKPRLTKLSPIGGQDSIKESNFGSGLGRNGSPNSTGHDSRKQTSKSSTAAVPDRPKTSRGPSNSSTPSKTAAATTTSAVKPLNPIKKTALPGLQQSGDAEILQFDADSPLRSSTPSSSPSSSTAFPQEKRSGKKNNKMYGSAAKASRKNNIPDDHGRLSSTSSTTQKLKLKNDSFDENNDEEPVRERSSADMMVESRQQSREAAVFDPSWNNKTRQDVNLDLPSPVAPPLENPITHSEQNDHIPSTNPTTKHPISAARKPSESEESVLNAELSSKLNQLSMSQQKEQQQQEKRLDVLENHGVEKNPLSPIESASNNFFGSSQSGGGSRFSQSGGSIHLQSRSRPPEEAGQLFESADRQYQRLSLLQQLPAPAATDQLTDNQLDVVRKEIDDRIATLPAEIEIRLKTMDKKWENQLNANLKKVLEDFSAQKETPPPAPLRPDFSEEIEILQTNVLKLSEQLREKEKKLKEEIEIVESKSRESVNKTKKQYDEELKSMEMGFSKIRSRLRTEFEEQIAELRLSFTSKIEEIKKEQEKCMESMVEIKQNENSLVQNRTECNNAEEKMSLLPAQTNVSDEKSQTESHIDIDETEIIQRAQKILRNRAVQQSGEGRIHETFQMQHQPIKFNNLMYPKPTILDSDLVDSMMEDRWNAFKAQSGGGHGGGMAYRPPRKSFLSVLLPTSPHILSTYKHHHPTSAATNNNNPTQGRSADYELDQLRQWITNSKAKLSSPPY